MSFSSSFLFYLSHLFFTTTISLQLVRSPRAWHEARPKLHDRPVDKSRLISINSKRHYLTQSYPHKNYGVVGLTIFLNFFYSAPFTAAFFVDIGSFPPFPSSVWEIILCFIFRLNKQISAHICRQRKQFSFFSSIKIDIY